LPVRSKLWLPILLLLIPWGALAAAPKQDEPAIVLQLPPGMSADQVRDLIAGLRDKGATVTPTPAAVTAEEPLAHRIVARIEQAWPKLPETFDLRRNWRDALDAEHRPHEGFWLALIGLVAGAWLLERAIRAALPALWPRLRIAPGLPLHRAFARHCFCLVLGLAGFVVAVRLGGGFIGRNSALLTGTAAQVVDSAVRWRLAAAFLALVAAPGLTPARPLYIDDAGARLMSNWIGFYLLYVMAFLPGIWLVRQIGSPELVLDLALVQGIAIMFYKIAMFLHIRHAVSAAILVAGGPHPRPARRFAAAFWHWFFILLSIAVFVLTIVQYAVGDSALAGGGAAALQAVIVGMALAWAAKQRFIAEYGDHHHAHWWRPVVNRLVDMAVMIGGFAWLATLWGFDVFDPDAAGITATILRPAFRASITLAVAWLVWTAIGGFLRERAPHPGGPAEEDGAVETGMTRLATLLPLIRNTLAVAIFFLGIMIALGDLGVDIGPLLAGAGVIGIALGFGAQALVRDVIAGLFFLIDDAFRLGEYIDTGRLKGTVEAISIRSLRLRHQNGQIHTIPFGLIQAVTNSSRDWAIIKFNLHIAPDSDLELVRKTVKQLGLALLQDPEIGTDFIQPLKMQGVADVTQAAIMIRCKFTARPLRPSYLRRQALREIIQRFAAAGIAFATPPSNASNPP
jgi:moderate conductance mechanosensitive channel